MNQTETQQPRTRAVSGKLVILGILAVALLGAGTSWLFRYHATHRAAEFWEPENATLIREAPLVTFSVFLSPVTVRPSRFSLEPRDRLYAREPQSRRDVTAARGLVHLRQALLEDRSFDWPRESFWGGDWERSNWPNVKWTHALVFSETATGRKAYLLFAPDSKLVTWSETNGALSYKPIASGIAEMFAEFETLPTMGLPAADPPSPKSPAPSP